jgi:hypothetical protein
VVVLVAGPRRRGSPPQRLAGNTGSKFVLPTSDLVGGGRGGRAVHERHVRMHDGLAVRGELKVVEVAGVRMAELTNRRVGSGRVVEDRG